MKVFIAGDICTDVYLFSDKRKDNPEHPTPIYSIVNKATIPGMAANVARNFVDGDIDAQLFHNSKEPHIQKTRLYYNNEYVHRIDYDVYMPRCNWNAIEESLKRIVKKADAIVVSDYGKDFWSPERLALLNESTKPVFIDPCLTTKLEDYPKCTAITPNLKEGQILTGEKDPLKICETIAQNVTCEYVILKRGAEATILYTVKNNQYYMFPTENVPVVDVCGAGDTFIASLTTLYLKGYTIEHCVEGANKAAAITVQHIGAHAPTQDEWQSILNGLKEKS